MNEYSLRGEPFYVLISYNAMSGFFIPATEMNENFIQLAFHSSPVKQKFKLPEWKVIPVEKEQYASRFNFVMNQLHLGNSFLVNLTQPSIVQTDSDLLSLFEMADAPYKGWLNNGFVFFSPECFVKISNGHIRTFPMKGTLDASVADAENKLLMNEKEKAEHATIVDLLRNDLSIVATDVEVSRYRYIDRVTTHRGELLQVSSEICGRLPDNYKSAMGDIIFSLLPAGSISGAPKPKTLEIIDQVEGYDRGFYTGICGYFDGNDFDSAVMIRFLEQTADGLVFKSGGGITFRSEIENEYLELKQKVYVPLYRSN